MDYHNKLLLSVFLAHVLAIVGIYAYWDPLMLICGYLISSFIFVNIGQEAGLHRYFSHRSYKMPLWKENIILFLSVFALTGNSLGWVARHRTHHKHSDQDSDPHKAADWFRTWFWIEPKKPMMVNTNIIKDMMRNPMHRFTRDHYFKIYWGTVALVALLLGPKIALYFFVVVGALNIHSSGLVNVFCHMYGYRNFEINDRSTNNKWVNLWVKGAGLHNNHHADPSNYTTKVKPGEWDLTGWFIRKFLDQSLSPKI